MEHTVQKRVKGILKSNIPAHSFDNPLNISAQAETKVKLNAKRQKKGIKFCNSPTNIPAGYNDFGRANMVYIIYK